MKDVVSTRTTSYHKWPDIKNVLCPKHYIDDFSSDKGYFTEDNGVSDWKIENGMLFNEDSEGETLTYIHVFEKNVCFKARVKITEANPPYAAFGMLLRYNAEFAYCRVSYHYGSKVWAIDYREDADHECFRMATSNDHPMEAGRWYDITFTIDGDRAVLTLDDKQVFDISEMCQLSPGRIGFFTNRTAIAVDNVDIALLSGEGTILKNVKHTMLAPDKYMEGGSVMELTDGTLKYIGPAYAKYSAASDDNGKSWVPSDVPFAAVFSHPCVYRLADGRLMNITKKELGGAEYILSQTSEDDGKTWTDGGVIAPFIHDKDPSYRAITMNDKITQSPRTGRLFFGMAYEQRQGGNGVFVDTYCSDDGGSTWTLLINSRELSGHVNANRFSETMVIECDDGTLRMYGSWNCHPCVVYSESCDNGATWGPLCEIPELICAVSSMQLVRDTYADNDSTYYMVWVNSPAMYFGSGMTRSRLSLAKSTNGKDWHFLGDIWRWESRYVTAGGAHIAHAVDAFVKTTKDHIICGAGFSEELRKPVDSYHHAQRQHIYSIPKTSLE